MSENGENNLQVDETLDPIRPSISEVSYLYGRDPSILAYGQRPGPSVEQKKNLLSLYEESVVEISPTILDSTSNQTIKVYLRIKPFPKNAQLNEHQKEAYTISDGHTLLTKIPNQDSLSNSTVKSHSSIASDIVCRKYTFTETFGPTTTQFQFFDRVVKSQMQDFLTGCNATIMTYGTTNSGKTFTLQGTTSSPGIIPRGLEYVFSQINTKSLPSYKPINSNRVISLTPIDKAQELDIKNKLLAFSTTDRNQYINTYKQMQKLLEEESPNRTSEPTNAQYAVWVSFAEIYNESIYDLLSNDTHQKNRLGLKLMTDNNGVAYIKGLKPVFVTSGSEAFQILMAGQYNLKVAATALNARSSRSHCIFTIKLLKYFKENDPDSVEVSTFSFCDLAGSERLKKTLNVGDRLKESQNINTSLLVLGRCLKSIYEGQTIKQRNEHVGPFRESKLTRLFQKPLSGKEPIVLVVNVNPIPNLYVETQNVLNFAAIAKKIILQPKKSKKRKSKSRFSQVVMKNKKNVIDWEDPELDNIIEETLSDEDCDDSIQPEDLEDLLIENEKLKKEIENWKSLAIKKEMEAREEMAKLHEDMVQTLERDYMNRLEEVQEQQQDLRDWEVEKVEKYYEEKLIELTSKKRKRSRFYNDDDDDGLCDEDQMKDMMVEIENLSSKVVSLKSRLKESKKEKEAAIQEKNTLTYHLSLVKEQLKASEKLKKSMEEDVGSNDSSSYIEELKVQLSEQEKKNSTLKKILHEAQQEYIEIENELEQKDSQIQKLKNELAARKEQIEDLQNELDNVQEILNKQTDIITSLDKKVESQAQQLIETDKCYDELKEIYDAKMKEIEELKSNLSDEENKKIAELQDNLAQVESENSQLNEKLCRNNDEIEALKINRDQLKIDFNEVFKKLEMLNSHPELLQAGSKLNKEIEKEVTESCDSGCQTAFVTPVDQSNQTSFTQSFDDKILQTSCDDTIYRTLISESKLEELKNINDDLMDKYEQGISRISSLNDKIQHFEAIIQEKDHLNECLQQKKEKLEIQINELNNRVDILEKENKCLNESKESYLTKLTQMSEEIDSNHNKCETEHVVHITQLNEEVENTKKISDQYRELIDQYVEKISVLERNLNEKITELNGHLDNCQLEKKLNEEKIEENANKIKSLEDRVEQSLRKLIDKDDEISRLQKEIKNSIKSNINEEDIKKTEEQLKKTLKELNEAKNSQVQTDELNKNLQTKLVKLESTLKNIEGQQKQINELQDMNRSLLSAINEKEHEFHQFKKNRDELVTGYETALKNMQNELNKANDEIVRLKVTKDVRVQTENEKFRAPLSDKALYKASRENKPPKEKEDITSDEEVIPERRGRRNRKLLDPPITPTNITEILLSETSGSESKRSTRNTTKSNLTCASSNKKTTRRKKLYTRVNDSYMDCDTTCEPLVSPAPSTRSLRTRKK